MTNENKEQLLDALYAALPCVEYGATDGGYSDSHILNVLRKIHLAIALLEEPNEGND